jgi:AraC-like DNA-binding protein
VRSETAERRRRLYVLSRGIVAKHYRRHLTLAALARALCSSPRQIQRAYEEFGTQSFHEDLRGRRLSAAATLLYEQPAIGVADVARLVGYRHAAHFARAFRLRFGVSPASFREQGRRHRAVVAASGHNGGDGVAWSGTGGGPRRGGAG